jgi:hypothetical protein
MGGLGVEAAYEMNLLEDIVEGAVHILRSTDGVEHELGLDLTFHGFGVEMLVLVLGDLAKEAKA